MTSFKWFAHIESFPEASMESRNQRLEISQAISLKRIADALEKIAAKPAIDPEELGRQINTAIVERGYTIARHMRGQ
jgi:hypothetical protein